MPGPEHQPSSPDLEAPAQEVPEQVEIPRELEEATGVQAVPHQPQPLQQKGKIVAQPMIPARDPSGSSITIPAHDEKELEQMAKGDLESSETWFGAYWLYRLHKAIRSGVKAIYGN